MKVIYLQEQKDAICLVLGVVVACSCARNYKAKKFMVRRDLHVAPAM